MNCSISSHCLTNDLYAFIMLHQKLCLHIQLLTNCLTCWCDMVHDCYGIHTFSYVSNHRGIVHSIIKKGSITTIMCFLTMTKLLPPTYKVDEEKKNLVPVRLVAHPLDALLSLDPNLDNPTIPQYPYTDIYAWTSTPSLYPSFLLIFSYTCSIGRRRK